MHSYLNLSHRCVSAIYININIQGRCTLSFKTYSDICVTYVSISIAAKKRH